MKVNKVDRKKLKERIIKMIESLEYEDAINKPKETKKKIDKIIRLVDSLQPPTNH